MKNLSPIIIFVYDRPDHTRKTIEALLRNNLSAESDIFIYSDAAKNEGQFNSVQEVRDYIKNINGFKTVTIVEREKNWGLANSIIDGVTKIVNEYGKIIVLEDDLLTSPYFLIYMNEALEKYERDERIISIHGYTYPVKQNLPEAFFLKGADCWGWATWKRGWELFNSDGQFLLDELSERNLINDFDFNGSYPYSKMLIGQIKGTNDSWAVRWYASAFLADKLTLYPGRSLVHNIGLDDSGTHSGKSSEMDVDLSEVVIDLDAVTVTPSQEATQAFEIFFRQLQVGLLRKIFRKIRFLFKAIYK